MYNFEVKRYQRLGELYPVENMVILKHWKDVYNFSNMFKDSLTVDKGLEIESYVYLNLSAEIKEYLLCNHGGWMPKSTVDEQCEFIFYRFVNLLNVIYPWFRSLEKYQLIKYSKDMVNIEWIDVQAENLIRHEFSNLWWQLEGRIKNCFRESEALATKNEVWEYVKNVYKIP